MGSKGKKPLSVMEKRQKRAVEGEKKEEKKPRREKAEKYVNLTSALNIDSSLYDRVSREILDEAVITPSQIAQKYTLPVSVAKALLRHLERGGVVRLVSRSRRTMVYIPSKASGSAS